MPLVVYFTILFPANRYISISELSTIPILVIGESPVVEMKDSVSPMFWA